MRDIKQLTGLRGIAAFLVVVSHIANAGALPWVLGHGLGNVGVMVFFELSGFLMAYLYINRPFSHENVVSFARARVGRVMPLYLVIVALTALATALAVPHWHYDLGGLAVRALLFIEVPGELWTIPVEVQFYVAFAVVWFFWQRGNRRAMPIVIAALSVLLAAGYIVLVGRLAFVMGLFAPAFFIGATVGAHWEERISPWASRHRIGLNRLAAIGLVGFCVNLPGVRELTGTTVTGSTLGKIWFDPTNYLVVTVLLITAAAQVPTMRFLNTRTLQWLGAISYGLYLVHPLVLEGVEAFTEQPVLVAVLTLAGSLALAQLSYVLLETPARRLIRGRPRATAQPAGATLS